MDPFSQLLRPFSFVFGTGVKVRNYLYDRRFFHQFPSPVPTISVGNISLGGTGKTPTSEYILRFYSRKGLQLGYLSRGYGRKSKGYYLVSNAEGDSNRFGDEALQVAHKFPEVKVAVCEDRRTGIERLVKEEGVELIVLDDAFQHRKVSRDLDIVLIDANRLPTNDYILPTGRLRESLDSLKRSQLIIVNKVKSRHNIPAIEEALSSYNEQIAFSKPVLGEMVPSASSPNLEVPPLKNLPVLLFSGIGNNAYFQYQVEGAEAQVLQTLYFRDHHPYSEADLQKIVKEAQNLSQKSPNLGPIWILTTEKDYFRLRGMSKILTAYTYFGYLPIRLHWIKGQSMVHSHLENLIK
ncbi:MAG: tetraacyldisaccharide 4'-kinase [Bacteroidota bacterium]